jgi:hypothetical protein
MADLTFKTFNYVSEDGPFKNDLFEREALAQKLTSYIDRAHGGCVVAINAAWGDGKSWFGRNWERSLSQQGYESIFIDAFASDYSADPFWLIASAISARTKGADKKALQGAAAKVAKALLPVAAKLVTKAVVNHLVGDSDIDGLLDSGDIGDAAQKFANKELARHEQHAKSVESFKNALQKFTSGLDKKLVIFVDELDRCTPEFSVRLLERIKHFFDVDNTLIVLLINQQQLEQAIKGVYGTDIDAAAYLNKFINVTFNLPKRVADQYDDNDYNRRYCAELADRHHLEENQGTGIFVRALCAIAPAFKMSFRDLERAFTLFSLAYPVTSNPARAGAFAFLIGLKLKQPALFVELLNDSVPAYEKADVILSTIRMTDDTFPSTLGSALSTVLRARAGAPIHSEDMGVRQFIAGLTFHMQNPNLTIPT